MAVLLDTGGYLICPTYRGVWNIHHLQFLGADTTQMWNQKVKNYIFLQNLMPDFPVQIVCLYIVI